MATLNFSHFVNNVTNTLIYYVYSSPQHKNIRIRVYHPDFKWTVHTSVVSNDPLNDCKNIYASDKWKALAFFNLVFICSSKYTQKEEEEDNRSRHSHQKVTSFARLVCTVFFSILIYWVVKDLKEHHNH